MATNTRAKIDVEGALIIEDQKHSVFASMESKNFIKKGRYSATYEATTVDQKQIAVKVLVEGDGQIVCGKKARVFF